MDQVSADLAKQTGLHCFEHASRSQIRSCCGRLALRHVASRPNLTPAKRRKLLFRLRNYAERWWQIKCTLTDYRPYFNEPLLRQMQSLFQIYCHHARSVRDRGEPEWGTRKVLLTYPYVATQILRILDYWEARAGIDSRYYHNYSWYWPKLKTPPKLLANDARWKLVLTDINLVRRDYDSMCPNISNRPWPVFLMAPLQLEIECKTINAFH